VKPGNILLGPDNQVFLADFGLAVTDDSPHATRSGLIIGSPAYMSPERARGESASPAADLWSLGATLYAAVEGRDPFERNGSAAVLAAVLTDDPDMPSQAGPLWPVISGLLDKDPQQRLTADQAYWMLQPVADTDDAAYLFDDATQLNAAGHTAVLPVTSSRERDSARRRRARRPIAIFLVSALAVAIGASLAAGELAGHHAAVPPVTRSVKPDPTPSDAGYSYAPRSGPGDQHGKHHDWKHGYGNGHGHGDGNGNGNGGD
jgi:serine/threonine protein kinase